MIACELESTGDIPSCPTSAMKQTCPMTISIRFSDHPSISIYIFPSDVYIPRPSTASTATDVTHHIVALLNQPFHYFHDVVSFNPPAIGTGQNTYRYSWCPIHHCTQDRPRFCVLHQLNWPYHRNLLFRLSQQSSPPALTQRGVAHLLLCHLRCDSCLMFWYFVVGVAGAIVRR